VVREFDDHLADQVVAADVVPLRDLRFCSGAVSVRIPQPDALPAVQPVPVGPHWAVGPFEPTVEIHLPAIRPGHLDQHRPPGVANAEERVARLAPRGRGRRLLAGGPVATERANLAPLHQGVVRALALLTLLDAGRAA